MLLVVGCDLCRDDGFAQEGQQEKVRRTEMKGHSRIGTVGV